MLYLAYDTETTGLPLNQNSTDFYDVVNWPRVYQLGAILFDEMGFEEGRMNRLVKPDGWKIPKVDDFMREMGHTSWHEQHGISTEMLMDLGSPLSQVMDEFIALAEKADEKVCHNAVFDLPVITCEMFRVKHFPYHWIQKPQHCTKLLSEPILQIPGFKGKYKWPSLQEAHKYFMGYEFDGAHDALADVTATMDVFLKIQTWFDNDYF